MTAQLGVAVQPGAEERGAVSLVIASLPISLTRCSTIEGTAVATVVAIDGTAGWTARAPDAITCGNRGVVVVEPVPERTTDLERSAQEREVPVILDHRWASNSAIKAARAELQLVTSTIAFVDLTAVVASRKLDETLDELRLIATILVDRLDDVHTITMSGDCVITVAHVPGSTIPVTMTAVRAPGEESTVRVRIVTQTGGIDLSIPDPDCALPATVVFTDRDGSSLAPTRWESSRRTSWRRLIDLVHAGRLSNDVGEFASVFNR